MEPQVEDRLHLPFGEAIGPARLLGIGLDRLDQADILGDIADRPFARQQLGARFRRSGSAADDRDHLVEVGHRDHQAQQHMRAVARLVELELGPPGDDLFAEADEGLDDVAQRQRLGPAAADCEHVGREARLRGRIAPDLVEHDLGRGVALEIDDHAHSFARAFVANVGDAFDPLLLGGVGDLLDQTGLADLEGDRGEDDRLAALALGTAGRLDLVACAHQDRAAPGGVGRLGAGMTQDQRRGGEIGTGDDLEQLFRGDRRVVDIGETAVDDLAQIVRRDIGRHADRDAARAVDQQVGEARGQDGGFAARAVVIVREIDRVLVEIVEQHVGNARQPRFGVAHRGGRIGIHRAEIALTVDQRHPQRPVLRHPRERFVDRGVAVRVVVAHHVADDLGALAIGTPGDEAAFLAGEQDASVDRLQTVAHIGKRARHDHAHRVIEIAGLHLIDDVDAGVAAACGSGFENVGVVAQKEVLLFGS